MRVMWIGLVLAATVAMALRCDAAVPAAISRGALYEFVATPAFANGAKEFYLEQVASDDARKSIISSTEDECGGRYDGTQVEMIELSHLIKTDKRSTTGDDKNYTVQFAASADLRWLIVETISCSLADGHSQSVLHAALVSGTETQLIDYKYADGKFSSRPTASDLQRSYKIDGAVLTDQYRAPIAKH